MNEPPSDFPSTDEHRVHQAQAPTTSSLRESTPDELARNDLAHAYRMLGKYLYITSRHRDCFADLYLELDSIRRRMQIAQIQARKRAEAINRLTVDQSECADECSPDHFAPSSAVAGLGAKDAAAAQALDQQGKPLLQRLGEEAYQRLGNDAGPDVLTSPIASLRTRLGEEP